MSDDLARDLASLRIERGGTTAPPSQSGVSPPSGGAGRAVRWGLGLALLGGVAFGARAMAPKIGERIWKQEVQVAEISIVSPAQASVELSSTGYVLPQTVAKVGTKVVGRLKTVSIKQGEHVKAGTVLFELDPTDQKTALAAAQAKVAAAASRSLSAKARAAAARANAAEMRAQRDRQKKLAEAGVATANNVEDLDLKLKGLDAQVLVADADTTAANADTASAQVDVSVYTANLASMTIVAPIDGTAVDKPATVGDVVSPGLSLVELADFSTLLIETDVPEARLGGVKVGGPCEIVLDAYPDKRLRGVVAEIVPKLNRAKASGTVKVKITDTAENVLPEMAARVSFLRKALEASELKEPPKKVVPAAAIVDRAGQKHVFVVDGGKLRLVPVTVGGPFGGGLELKEGPPPGTRVVKDPAPSLVDGQSVKEGSA